LRRQWDVASFKMESMRQGIANGDSHCSIFQKKQPKGTDWVRARLMAISSTAQGTSKADMPFATKRSLCDHCERIHL